MRKDDRPRAGPPERTVPLRVKSAILRVTAPLSSCSPSTDAFAYHTPHAGMFTRAAPIIMPGTILSQFGMHTTPSKQCARSIVSMESAMISREASE